jgi:hypothetical protein
MELKLNKFLPLAGLLCLCSMSSALAGTDDDYQKPAGQMQQMDSNGSYKEITPNAGPRVTNGVDVSVTADFIYWYAEQNGSEFVTTGFGTSPASGSVYKGTGEWVPGFKVGLGLALGHDGWDLAAEYTWLRSSTSSNITSSTLAPLWNIGNFFDAYTAGDITNATCNSNFHFNVVDLELGRNFYISQHLTLRPHAGLKGSWQTNHFNVSYTSDTPSVDEMSNNQKYWGIGLRSGVDSAWHFTKEWSIYGDVALSALWANFRTTRTDESSAAGVEGTEVTYLSTKTTVNAVQPVLEMALGLRWETWFSDNDYHFMIQAGWEAQNWFSMNHLVRILDDAAPSGTDLGLQGLTVKVRFDF